MRRSNPGRNRRPDAGLTVKRSLTRPNNQAAMFKAVYPDGEVNAAQIFKGYDVGTGRTGWHYQPFGETAQYIGNSLAEVQEYVEDVEAGRESA